MPTQAMIAPMIFAFSPDTKLNFWSMIRKPNISFVSGERSEEHTSELQSLMRISYAVFCLKKHTRHTPKQPPQDHRTPTSARLLMRQLDSSPYRTTPHRL